MFLLTEFKYLNFKFLLFSKFKTTKLLDVALTTGNIYAALFKYVRIGLPFDGVTVPF
jgi:hypothetical protein